MLYNLRKGNLNIFIIFKNAVGLIKCQGYYSGFFMGYNNTIRNFRSYGRKSTLQILTDILNVNQKFEIKGGHEIYSAF